MSLINVELSRHQYQQYAFVIFICVLTAALMTPFVGHLDLANIVMVFLFVVVLLSLKFGKTCAWLSAVLNVVLFDVFFVPPRFSLAVEDAQYLVTFVVMLATGLITGGMAAGLKHNEQQALAREKSTQAMYALAKLLAGVLSFEQVQQQTRQFIAQEFGVNAWLIKTQNAVLTAQDIDADVPFEMETHLATMALQSATTIHSTALIGMGKANVYVPIVIAQRIQGMLVIDAQQHLAHWHTREFAALEAVASLLAITLERLHYLDLAQQAQLDVVSERFRGTILSALSHDLRTPLTVLIGLADSLEIMHPNLPDDVLDTAKQMHLQALRLSNMVSNLLDMVRLHDGHTHLLREWHAMQDVIGASIAHLGQFLKHHHVQLDIPSHLPLVEMDAMLIERVFSNVLENAAKYSPAGSTIGVKVLELDTTVQVQITDQGKGFAHTHIDTAEGLAQLLSSRQRTANGFGLGLSICQMIMKAHGGRVCIQNLGNGACVSIEFQKGQPPQLPDEL